MRIGRSRAGFRRGFAAAGVAAALALTGCGYDPSTAGKQEPPTGSAPSVGDVDVAKQRAAHLVADAGQLLRATEHVQGDGAVPGEIKDLAGQVRGLLEMQTGRLDSDGGASMLTDGELQSVLGASGQQAGDAYVAMLRTHVPRLKSGWEGLVEAGDPDVAGVARDSVERLGALEAKLAELPGN